MNSSTAELRELADKIRSDEKQGRTDAIRSLFDIERYEANHLPKVALTWLKLLKEGKLRAEEIASHIPAILDLWTPIFEDLIRFEQTVPAADRMLEDGYRSKRAYAGVLLDLLGYLPRASVAPHLRKALSLQDSRLRFWAVVSLLRIGEQVDERDLEDVASRAEVRILLWDELRKLGKESLMPVRWATEEELAASALTSWAADPRELGTPPEEIELMARFPVEWEGETRDVYLFRFREYPKRWEKGEGWMAGIAGPFYDGERALSCWSAVDRWDAMSPVEHFDKLHPSRSVCFNRAE